MHYFVDQKFEGKWGNFYFVRNYYDSSLGDTAVGLIGVTHLRGRKCSFVAWAWELNDFGGTSKYLELVQADSVRFIVGPNEWWMDSVFWEGMMGDANDTTGLIF